MDSQLIFNKYGNLLSEAVNTIVVIEKEEIQQTICLYTSSVIIAFVNDR